MDVADLAWAVQKLFRIKQKGGVETKQDLNDGCIEK